MQEFQATLAWYSQDHLDRYNAHVNDTKSTEITPHLHKTKTNRDMFARVFSRLTPVICICFKIRLGDILAFFVMGESGYFDFGVTTPNWKHL